MQMAHITITITITITSHHITALIEHHITSSDHLIMSTSHAYHTYEKIENYHNYDTAT